MSPEQRRKHAKKTATMFKSFDVFLRFMFTVIHLFPTEVQRDIGEYLETGWVEKKNLLIMAQRGEGKSLITCIFMLWCLIQKPATRLVMFSAGLKKALENATLIINLIGHVEELQYLAPDPNVGRSSTQSWEVHHDLRLPDKSASLTCLGIGGNMQGIRADVLVSDDVETTVNSITEEQRLKLVAFTKDYTSICTSGIIIYLGTPQSSQSIYSGLEERGYATRIWTSRYPSAGLLDNYGGLLAPMIYERMTKNPDLQTGGGIFGDRGQVVDDQLTILDEAELCKKESDQGASYFNLQYMLDTTLSDMDRHPLKSSRIISYDFGTLQTYPETIVRSISPLDAIPMAVHGYRYQLAVPVSIPSTVLFIPMAQRVGVLDPSGGGANGDEVGVAIGGVVNSKVFVDNVAGFAGGYELPELQRIAAHLITHKVTLLVIEKNFGYGAFKAVFAPILMKACKEAKYPPISFIDIMNNKQKEARIIDVLEPVIGRGALIINQAIFQEEEDYLKTIPRDYRLTYALMYQLNNITKHKKSLIHDDRLDALAMLVEYLLKQIYADDYIDDDARETKAQTDFLRNFLKYGDPHKRHTIKNNNVNIFKRRS